MSMGRRIEDMLPEQQVDYFKFVAEATNNLVSVETQQGWMEAHRKRWAEQRLLAGQQPARKRQRKDKENAPAREEQQHSDAEDDGEQHSPDEDDEGPAAGVLPPAAAEGASDRVAVIVGDAGIGGPGLCQQLKPMREEKCELGERAVTCVPSSLFAMS